MVFMRNYPRLEDKIYYLQKINLWPLLNSFYA